MVLLNHQQLSLSQHFGSVPLACKLCAVALGGKGLVWCSSQLFGSVLLGSSESQTGSCRKSRAQSKIGASPAANKCFQFVASPPDAACGGAAEAGVMRPNQVGHFCRIVSSLRLVRVCKSFQSWRNSQVLFVACFVQCQQTVQFSFKLPKWLVQSWHVQRLLRHLCKFENSYSQRVVVQSFYSRAMAAQSLVLFAKRLFIHAGRLLVWLCATPAYRVFSSGIFSRTEFNG